MENTAAFSIDRFESETAVLISDDGTELNIPLSALSEGARPGDIVRCENGSYIIDADETEKRKNRIRKLQDKLFR